MKCPKCNSDNPQDSNFCMECGTKMEQVCSHCGKSVPLRAKFCIECGQSFCQPAKPLQKELSIKEKLHKVQRYLPEGLLKKVLSQKDSIEGERRQVTIMFCDMKGFTGLTEKLGPDKTFSLMDKIFEILLRKINQYQGTVNEFRGDGILAFFGAPIALEDAPQRAIRSALSIHREIYRFNEGISDRWDNTPIQLRIGINTGDVVVGTVGNDLRLQYTAQGDTINMASRIESLAEPGTTFVSEETFKLAEGYFRFEALGAQTVKGKTDPIKVYKVIAPSSRRTRFDVSAERGLTPLVGRQRELELLLDGYQRSKSGRGQSFAIVSEAGLGKSRLLYEFRNKIANDNITFLEGRCLSFSRGIAYHPIIDVLKSNFNLSDTDDDNTITRKVKNGLDAINADDPVTQTYILELLSVEDTPNRAIIISQEEKKYRLIEALKRIVIKGSEMRPLVLAIEDLHWIDKSSEDAFKSLLGSISGARVLLIFTYRPDYVHTWGTWTYHSQLNLIRFSNRESLMMVYHLLGTTKVEVKLEDLILEKTDGVPFFIEEFIKSLKDLSILERKANVVRLAKVLRKFTIPNTIQEVIMARVDTLPEGAREVLVTGAVIEREFNHNLIRDVTGASEQELLTCLSILKDAEIIYERGLYPHSNYIFKHALTHEVVYDSIISSKRKQLHEKIGHSIEQLYQDTIQEYYSVLAQHYIRSENYEKGAEFSKIASKRAFGQASFNEAIEHIRNLILCLEQLPLSESIQKMVVTARTTLAMYLINVSQLDGLSDVVAPIEDIAVKLNDQKSLARIYIALGCYEYAISEDNKKALRYMDDALKISSLSKDYLSAYYASLYIGITFTWSCEFSKAQHNYNKCIELSTAANNPIGMSNPKALASWAYCYWGKLEKAFKISKAGLEAADQSDYFFNKAPAYTSYGISCYFLGFFKEAEKYLMMGIDYSKNLSQIGWEHWGCFYLGNLYIDIGKLDSASKYFAESPIMQHSQILPSWVNNCRVALAKVNALRKEKNINLNELYKMYDLNNIEVTRGYIAQNISEVLITIGNKNINDAELWIHKAIENDQKNSLMWMLARDYAVYAKILHMSCEKKKADEYFQKAMNTFENCGAKEWIIKAKNEYNKYS